MGAFTLDVDGSISGGGDLTSTGASNILIGTDLSVAGTFTPNISTVTFNELTATSTGAYSFYNLVLNKGAAATGVTSTGVWIVTNSFTMTQGTWTSGAFIHQIAGSWDSSSANFTWDETGNTIRLTTTNAGIITGGGAADPFNNLTVDDGAVLSTSDVNVTGTLLVSGGTVNPATRILTVGTLDHQVVGASISGTTGSVVVTNATISRPISMDGGAITFTGGAVTLTGTTSLSTTTAGDITLNSTFSGGSDLSVSAAGDVYITADVGVSGSGLTPLTAVGLTGTTIYLGAGIETANSGLSFNSPVVLTANTLLSTGGGAGNIGFNSTLNTNGTAWTLGLTAGTGDVTFSNIVGTSALSGNRPGTLTITSATTVNQNANVFLSGGLVITSGDWSVGALTLDVDGSISGAGDLTSTGASNILIGTDLSVSGTFTPNASTVTFNELTATSTGAYSFYNLVLNKGAAATGVTSTGVWIVTNSFTMTQGTWTSGAFTHQIAGSWDSSSVNFSWDETGNTIRLTTTNAGIVTGGGAADPFNNLTLDNGGALGSNTNVTGALLLSDGTLNPSTYTLTVGTLDHQVATASISGTTGTVNITNATLGRPITMLDGTISFSGGAVTLSGNTVLTTANTTGGVISLGSTFDQAFNLTLDAGSSAVNITSAIGGGTRVAAVDLTGSVINLGAGISTNNSTLVFNSPVILTANTLLDTNTAAGNIQFVSTLQTDGTARTLGLTAGAGSVTFGGIVGNGGANALGALTISSAAAGVTSGAGDTIDAASMSITNGGNVDLNGAVTAAGGFSSTGVTTGTFDNTGAPITTTNSNIAISHGGAVTIGSALDTSGGAGNVEIDSDVSVTVNGAGAVTAGSGYVLFGFNRAGGTVSTAAGITTAGTGSSDGNFATHEAGDIKFNVPLVLSGSVTFSSGAGNDGDIVFRGTVNGTAGTENLVLTAGTGDVYFSEPALSFTAPIGETTAIGNLTVTGADIYLHSLGNAGNTGASGAVNITASNGLVLNGSYYRTTGDQVYNSGPGAARWNHSGNGDFEVTGGSSLIQFDDVYLDFNGVTISLVTDIITGQFVFYDGTIDLNGHAITTSNNGGGDFVVFGSAFDPDDPDWNAANDDLRFDYINRAALLYDPETVIIGGWPYSYNAALTDSTGNGTIEVGVYPGTGTGNFYVNGTDLLTAGNWNLNIQNNNDVGVLSPNNTTAATDWGTTYNVVFNSTVSNSTLNGGGVNPGIVGAAEPSTGTNHNVTDGTGNTAYSAPSTALAEDAYGWNFTDPSIVLLETVWDNVLHIQFSEAVENSNNDINLALATNLMTVQNGTIPMNHASGDVAYAGFDITNGTLSNPLSSGAYNSIQDFYIRTDQTTWNTDADGTSLGNGDNISSDTYGSHQTVVPNLELIKSLFYSAGGKTPVGDYTGANRNTSTADSAPPVLVGVKAGTAAYNAAPAADYSNGHNYFIFRFSERMSFSTLGTGNIAANSNTRVGGQAVDSGIMGHMQDQLVAGTVTVDGLMDYTGVFDSGYISSFSIDPTPDYINTLERTTPYELRVDIAAYYDTGNSEWPGFLGSTGVTLTNPDGLAFTGVYDSTIQDLAGNSAAAVNSGRTINQDMGFNSGSGWVGITETGWDVDPPILAPYRGSATLEIIPEDEDSNTFLDRFEFHVLDNSSDGAVWDSETDHPNALGGGVRDSSLQSLVAFEFEALGIEPADLTGPTFDTQVLNSVFSLTGITDPDDSYFSIYPSGNTSWDTLTKLWVDYDEDEGYLTDLAGNRLRTFTRERAVEIVPPNISLTLAIPGNSWGYVKFSEQVYGNDVASAPITASDFSLSGVSGISITSVDDWPGGVPNQEYRFRFSGALTENDILSASINILPLAVFDVEGNYARSQLVYRVSDLGFGIVDPLWASDGIHSEDIREGTSLTVFDGTGKLMDRDILLQARINASSFQGLSMSMYYDADVPSDLVTNNLWLPYYHEELAPSGNYDARYVNPSTVLGNGLQEFTISSSDEDMETDNTIEFFFMLNGLPCVDLDDPDDVFSFHPWSFQIKDIRKQKGGVTILNNIINPHNGDEAILMYDLDDPGIVTVQVFALNGNMVRILQRGRQAEGTYQYLWDGRNNSGRIVARGVYFIRVVGPEVDEIRKVMVVK